MNTVPNPSLRKLFADLHNHSVLTASGLDSEQASEIIFHPLRLSNEEDQQRHRERYGVSDCHHAHVGYDNGRMYCTRCGKSCDIVEPRN